VIVKATIKDPSGKIFTIVSRSIAKNKAYTSPIVKFDKPGTYVMTVTAGASKRVVTVKVSK
jgi:hypothetical protein